MKLLTLNFVTCAVKACRAAATASTSLSQQPQASPGPPTPAEDIDPDQQPKRPSFPLHLSEVELVSQELDFNELFWRNVLGRLDISAMGRVLEECGLKLPQGLFTAKAGGEGVGEGDVAMGGVAEGDGRVIRGDEAVVDGKTVDEEVLRKLHKLLLETQVQEGWLVCGRCGHKYAVKEGIPNFLLPPHLVG